MLPKGQQKLADGLLLLLYGFRKLKQQEMVLSLDLMKAARQSGIQLPRLDRTLAKHKELVVEGGAGKGKRYGLNNLGITRAEEIMGGLLG